MIQQKDIAPSSPTRGTYPHPNTPGSATDKTTTPQPEATTPSHTGTQPAVAPISTTYALPTLT